MSNKTSIPHRYATRYQSTLRLPSSIQTDGPGIKAFCDVTKIFSIQDCANMLVDLKIYKLSRHCDKVELLRQIRQSLRIRGLLQNMNIDCLVMIIGTAVIHEYKAQEDADGHVEKVLRAWAKMEALASL